MSPSQWRKSVGLSQAQVARLLGIVGRNPARTWQRYELGQRHPRADVIFAVQRMSKGKVTAQSWTSLAADMDFTATPTHIVQPAA